IHSGRKQGEKLYDLVSIQMNISAREYSDLWLFIYDIEQSELPMRIENWTGSLKSAMGETGSGQSGGAGIFVTLEVAAINIKK
ncbi:MAG: hypothetical protein U1D99_00200, partial [Candidatus Omnitrophota bacterium]|nr:hypothetical protein [Candidatus Omnitrophota bacterium]